MTKSVTIKCDACEKEIGCTGYSSEYYLSLNNIPRPSCGGAVYAMALWPAFDSDKHFCGAQCLKKWVGENVK